MIIDRWRSAMKEQPPPPPLPSYPLARHKAKMRWIPLQFQERPFNIAGSLANNFYCQNVCYAASVQGPRHMSIQAMVMYLGPCDSSRKACGLPARGVGQAPCSSDRALLAKKKHTGKQERMSCAIMPLPTPLLSHGFNQVCVCTLFYTVPSMQLSWCPSRLALPSLNPMGMSDITLLS